MYFSEFWKTRFPGNWEAGIMNMSFIQIILDYLNDHTRLTLSSLFVFLRLASCWNMWLSLQAKIKKTLRSWHLTMTRYTHTYIYICRFGRFNVAIKHIFKRISISAGVVLLWLYVCYILFWIQEFFSVCLSVLSLTPKINPIMSSLHSFQNICIFIALIFFFF